MVYPCIRQSTSIEYIITIILSVYCQYFCVSVYSIVCLSVTGVDGRGCDGLQWDYSVYCQCSSASLYTVQFVCLQQEWMARDVKLYNEIIQFIVSVAVSVCLQYSLFVCNRSGWPGMWSFTMRIFSLLSVLFCQFVYSIVYCQCSCVSVFTV